MHEHIVGKLIIVGCSGPCLLLVRCQTELGVPTDFCGSFILALVYKLSIENRIIKCSVDIDMEIVINHQEVVLHFQCLDQLDRSRKELLESQLQRL